MKVKLSSLLRKVFLGSLAGISANNTNAGNNEVSEINTDVNDKKFVSHINKKVDLTPKLLLKRNNANELIAMAHRSHRSHSSHSSHRSHYSSYNSGGNNTPNNNTNLSPGAKGNNSNNSSSNSGASESVLKLGSRTLKKGMSGTDVTELVNILIKKEYLKLDGGGQVTGSYTFDTVIEDAVKKFQTDNGLEGDGICGSTTIYYLKNK